MKYLIGITVFILVFLVAYFFDKADLIFSTLIGSAWGLTAAIIKYLDQEVIKQVSKKTEKEESEFQWDWSGKLIFFFGLIIPTLPNLFNLDQEFWSALKFLLLGVYGLIVALGFLFVFKYKISKR